MERFTKKGSNGLTTVFALTQLLNKKSTKKYFYTNTTESQYGDIHNISEGVITIQFVKPLSLFGISKSSYNFLTQEDHNSEMLITREEAQVYLRKYRIDLNKEFPQV